MQNSVQLHPSATPPLIDQGDYLCCTPSFTVCLPYYVLRRSRKHKFLYVPRSYEFMWMDPFGMCAPLLWISDRPIITRRRRASTAPLRWERRLPEPRKVEAPPAGAGVAPTVEEFARSFQAKPGVHDVTIRNPATGEPNKVHFVLPDDTVRRVVFDHTSIEFDYGLLRFVRIDFETKGPVVSAR